MTCASWEYTHGGTRLVEAALDSPAVTFMDPDGGN